MKLRIVLSISLAVLMVSQSDIRGFAGDSPLKTLAIIDTGVDMTSTAIAKNIAYQVCFAGYKSCPNGQPTQEGPGAASISPKMLTNKEWVHGTKVASAAVQTDPSIQIIEIRCASLIGASGYIGCNNDLLNTALNWVVTNKDKFNIGAIASPLGTLGTTCEDKAPYLSTIKKLASLQIPVIFPTGNNFNYTKIDSPACAPGVIAISSIDDKGRLALYANYSPRVDFAAPGNLTVAVANNQTIADYGTSLSIAVFAADWLMIAKAKNLSYQAEYDLIKSSGTNYTNIMVKKNVIGVNLVSALK